MAMGVNGLASQCLEARLESDGNQMPVFVQEQIPRLVPFARWRRRNAFFEDAALKRTLNHAHNFVNLSGTDAFYITALKI